MDNISNVLARIETIRSQMGIPMRHGGFETALDAAMAAGDPSSGTAPEASQDEAADPAFRATPVARSHPTVGSVSMGAMVGAPGGLFGVVLPARLGIATAGELQAYLRTHRIAERNGRLHDSELVEVAGAWEGTGKLLPPAAEAFEALRAAALEDGIELRTVGTYRTYDVQAWARQAYLDGRKKAHVLPPGHSVHGAGLAVDFTNGAVLGRDDEEWHWLRANARDYGWYPISNETWHWEFRGVAA